MEAVLNFLSGSVRRAWQVEWDSHRFCQRYGGAGENVSLATNVRIEIKHALRKLRDEKVHKVWESHAKDSHSGWERLEIPISCVVGITLLKGKIRLRE